MTTVTLTPKEKRKLRPQYSELNMKGKYALADVNNIGYVDLECENLDGNWGCIITASVYIRNVQDESKNKIVSWRITKKDLRRYERSGLKDEPDKHLVESLIKCLSKLDLVMTHYGVGWNKFDMPFLRTRAAVVGVKQLPYKKVKYGDVWKYSHLLFKVNSYRLETIGDLYGFKLKTKLDPKYWRGAKIGNKKSIDYILKHNKKDVLLTYKIHKEIESMMPVPAVYL